MLQDIVSEVMKEMDGMVMTAIEIVAMAAQSTQTIWTNVAMADLHCQTPGSGVGEPCMVIPTRHNREVLMYPDPDILIFNSIPNATIETINITFTNNKAMVI